VSEAAGRPTEKISVVIPAHDSAAQLLEVLSAIIAQSLPPDRIILFDDGSHDGTAAIARRLGVDVIEGSTPPKGPAYGRNVGATAAEDGIIVFVDADVVLAEDALHRLVAEMQTTGADAAFGSYTDAPRSSGVVSLYANLRHHHVHQLGSRDARTFWTGIGAVRRSAFIDAGGFDPAQFPRPSIEDIDLGARLIRRGSTIRLVPEAQGVHLKEWSLAQLWATDIMRRAYPWSKLLLSGLAPPGQLNVSRIEQLKALFAMAVAALLLLSIMQPIALFGALLCTTCYVWLNRSFLRLMARRGGFRGLFAGTILHWIYHLYSTGTYVTVKLMMLAGWRPAKAR